MRKYDPEKTLAGVEELVMDAEGWEHEARRYRDALIRCRAIGIHARRRRDARRIAEIADAALRPDFMAQGDS